jgi:hypothetical protein
MGRKDAADDRQEHTRPARDAHIAIVGHITKDELLRYITATELANGYFNRFLVIAVQRSQELPYGGRLAGDELARVRAAVLTALRFASLPRPLAFEVSGG